MIYSTCEPLEVAVCELIMEKVGEYRSDIRARVPGVAKLEFDVGFFRVKVKNRGVAEEVVSILRSNWTVGELVELDVPEKIQADEVSQYTF